jgi:biotin transport system substrate-specific component
MNATLATKLWPATAMSSMVRNVVLAILGSLLLAVAANVSVPMWPVPMTLQTLGVLLIGGAYGSRLGIATIVLYLVEGLVGLPFFAEGHHGLFNADGTIFATIGFWFGFVLAAGLVGRLAESGWINSIPRMIAATFAGAVVLYIPGLIWLGVWAAKTQGMDASAATAAAFNWGLIPFIPGDIIKAAIAGLGLSVAWNGVKK